MMDFSQRIRRETATTTHSERAATRDADCYETHGQGD
jgi:hypothetical protein